MAIGVLRADEFIRAIAPSIDVDPSKVACVVIEARVGEAVRVYVEQYGTRKMLAFDFAGELRDSEIKVVDRAPEGGGQ